MTRSELLVVGALVCACMTGVSAQDVGQDVRTDAETYFYECGYCHLPGGTGTVMLGRRLGDDSALLAERDDLTADYVRFVVRNGLVSMPPLTRVELTEGELEKVVSFLTGED
jgi:hypothetical protein